LIHKKITRMFKLDFFILTFFIFQSCLALDNGVARTPPLGWLTWTKYACTIDCKTYPNDCISEKLIRRQADVLAREYLKHGYEYIIIDDCWSEMERDKITNELVADRQRFPNGIKKLADYVHSKGLKMGIYSDIGVKTCAGYPGHQDPNDPKKFYFDIDAQTFAKWGIDFLKVDGCFGNQTEYSETFPALTESLNKTGRPIVLNIEWPIYPLENKNLNLSEVASISNVFRYYNDINFSFDSVLSTMDFFAKNQDVYANIQGPGKWFDPDMILVGNNGLSFEQMKVQMAIWSLWSAPLLMSNDLHKVSDKEKNLLKNRHLLAINQDKEGILGKRVVKDGDFEVWLKPLKPVSIDNVQHRQFAVVYLNRATLGPAKYFSRTVREMILGYGKTKLFDPETELKKQENQSIKYKALDIFNNESYLGHYHVNASLTLLVEVAGSVEMLKLVPTLAH